MQPAGLAPYLTMVSVDDIIHHITQALAGSTDAAPKPGADSIPAGSQLQVRLCITADVEDTELRYLLRYDRGHTLYFRLGDYAYGERLANDLCDIIPGTEPDIGLCTEDQLSQKDRLYLFIHIRHNSARRAKPHPLKAFSQLAASTNKDPGPA
jgi:hypothetical protein